VSARLVILASGRGSNAAAVMDATRDGRLVAMVAGVISDVPGAGVLEEARMRGVEAMVVAPDTGEPRPSYDARLAAEVVARGPDLVVLAGWMRILSMSFLGVMSCPVINLHPALPGELPGTRAIERAHAERHAGRTHSGVMVHHVPDERVDEGPVIAVRRVELHPADTLEDFARRIHAAEHEALVEAIAACLAATGAGDRTR
jgi:formyltetrahydrofolate-dependent phosphoribosylglycinamide formyltransferase